MMKVRTLITSIFLLFFFTINAQVTDEGIDYTNPKEYSIVKLTFSGTYFIDTSICKLVTGLYVGDKIDIPGTKITKAIQNLWKQGLFDNIRITAPLIDGDKIWLDFFLIEHPRLSAQPLFSSNIKKGDVDNLREKMNLNRGDVINQNVIMKCTDIIKKYYIEKGFLNVDVKIKEKVDSADNRYTSKLFVEINKNKRVKINKINIYGNDNISDQTFKHKFKKTKERSVFKPFDGADTLLFQSVKQIFIHDSTEILDDIIDHFSKKVVIRLFKGAKYLEEDYNTDKQVIVEKYNELGYRDARILYDSVYRVGDKYVNIDIIIDEGEKYYFRNINWVGNSKYSSEELGSILKVNKGDVYNQKLMETNLNFNPNGFDVSSLYMDNGYLFFSVTPVEVAIVNDSIDIEIRVNEGKQAYINKVSVRGNTKTNDHVVIREMRTKPGQLFSRADVIRTTRELAQLRYFDAEKIRPDIQPNPVDGTVDIEYVVEETSSDQLELSGGWGMGRIIGTLGVSFNNFSTRNFFKKDAWRPLPTGDGQKLSVRAQSNGIYYQAYNASFTEPWLGGKKPNAFSISGFYSVQTNGVSRDDPERQAIYIAGGTLGLGKRLQWPDDYFTLYQEISYKNYKLENYYSSFSFSNGTSNELSYGITLARNSLDQPIYPRMGSEIMISLNLTPPYSLFSSKDYSTLPDAEKYKWIEFHKWKFFASWYTKLAGNLVLMARTKFGFLGLYNRALGVAPFERFYVGGDGLSGFSLDGREVIGLRGYTNNSITPVGDAGYVGGTIFTKYTAELRYPISLNPMATVFVAGFLEGGNAWENFHEFNPFNIYRSAGVGIRVYLPMFGLLGLDWGYGFDPIPNSPGANGSQFHFSINSSID
jgi:outer membrane protein insertion porin family